MLGPVDSRVALAGFIAGSALPAGAVAASPFVAGGDEPGAAPLLNGTASSAFSAPSADFGSAAEGAPLLDCPNRLSSCFYA